MAYAVNISGISDEILEFLGYSKVRENNEFVVYQDKYLEDYIVDKEKPYLFVEDLNDALILKRPIIDVSQACDGD